MIFSWNGRNGFPGSPEGAQYRNIYVRNEREGWRNGGGGVKVLWFQARKG